MASNCKTSQASSSSSRRRAANVLPATRGPARPFHSITVARANACKAPMLRTLLEVSQDGQGLLSPGQRQEQERRMAYYRLQGVVPSLKLGDPRVASINEAADYISHLHSVLEVKDQQIENLKEQLKQFNFNPVEFVEAVMSDSDDEGTEYILGM